MATWAVTLQGATAPMACVVCEHVSMDVAARALASYVGWLRDGETLDLVRREVSESSARAACLMTVMRISKALEGGAS